MTPEEPNEITNDAYLEYYENLSTIQALSGVSFECWQAGWNAAMEAVMSNYKSYVDCVVGDSFYDWLTQQRAK